MQPKSQPLLSHRGHGKAQSGARRSRRRWRGWEKLTGSLRVLRFLVKCRRFRRSRWKVGARSFMRRNYAHSGFVWIHKRTEGLMPRLPTSLTGGRRSPKGGPVSSGEQQAGLKSGRLRGTSEDQKIYVCACVCAQELQPGTPHVSRKHSRSAPTQILSLHRAWRMMRMRGERRAREGRWVGGREGEDKEVRFCSRNNLQAARDERSEAPTVAYVISLAALI